MQYADNINDLKVVIQGAIMSTLSRRTYFDAIIEEKPYVDQYATSDARMYFQAAFICAEQGKWDEALSWYKAGDTQFCGPDNAATIIDSDNEVYIECTEGTSWKIWCQGWITTPYGAKKDIFDLGDVVATPLPDGQAFIDRLNELRQLWFNRIEEAQTTMRYLRNRQ